MLACQNSGFLQPPGFGQLFVMQIGGNVHTFGGRYRRVVIFDRHDARRRGAIYTQQLSGLYVIQPNPLAKGIETGVPQGFGAP